jgi:hypothetical protein
LQAAVNTAQSATKPDMPSLLTSVRRHWRLAEVCELWEQVSVLTGGPQEVFKWRCLRIRKAESILAFFPC